MRGRTHALALCLGMLMGGPAIAQSPVPGYVTALEWSAYKDRFVTDSGRVIDDANGGISHSEGQGYGLLLAFLADDMAAFETIWAFTQAELGVREDALFAWKWDEDQLPPIVDMNNASDGDLLIAYALGLAGDAWDSPDKLAQARAIANDLGAHLVQRWRGRDILLPARFGFSRGERPDGPVINLSYWVFEAFPLLARLAPATDWQRLAQDGRRFVAETGFGASDLPSDWIALGGHEPVPASGFTPEFGYNNIRIPLYLIRAGHNGSALLGRYRAAWEAEGGPATRSVPDGGRIDRLDEPGYRIIGAALACVMDGVPVPASLREFAPTTYYASTLHLLTLAHLRQTAEPCL